jgi:hypothetical protein
MVHATDADYSATLAELAKQGIHIERRGRGRLFLVYRPDYRGAATARRVRLRSGAVRYRWERYGRLAAADVDYLATINLFPA